MDALSVDHSLPDPGEYDPEIGVVGCGSICEYHLEAYADAGYDVRALCDIDRERTVALRDRFYPEATVYEDHETLLANEDAEVIDATTYPEPRVGIVADAIDAGRHVLSQKPFVTDLADGRRLVERADDAGVTLAVNQNGRWAPQYRYMRAAVDAGLVGDVHCVSLERHWDKNSIAGDDIEHRLFFYYGIHVVDMVRCLLGGNPERVSAATARSPGQAPEEPLLGEVVLEYDSALARLTFNGDERGVEVSRGRVSGSDGTITSEGEDQNAETVCVHREEGTVSPALSGSWFPDGFGGAMAELLAAVAEDREPVHSARDNLGTVATTIAAIESARRGEAVEPAAVERLP